MIETSVMQPFGKLQLHHTNNTLLHTTSLLFPPTQPISYLFCINNVFSYGQFSIAIVKYPMINLKLIRLIL